jgi:hypothetical protein
MAHRREPKLAEAMPPLEAPVFLLSFGKAEPFRSSGGEAAQLRAKILLLFMTRRNGK